MPGLTARLGRWLPLADGAEELPFEIAHRNSEHALQDGTPTIPTRAIKPRPEKLRVVHGLYDVWRRAQLGLGALRCTLLEAITQGRGRLLALSCLIREQGQYPARRSADSDQFVIVDGLTPDNGFLELLGAKR